MNIFVHRASQCLTDHLAHGDGLICHSILNGLAKRDHHIFAFTDRAAIREPHPNLIVREHRATSRFSALHAWEQSRCADAWFVELSKTERFDLVWRMHPYSAGCPRAPRLNDAPLVVGPLFYSWSDAQIPSIFKLSRWSQPLALRGWKRTLNRASLILRATDRSFDRGKTLPVIVDPPPGSRAASDNLRLIFVGNLEPKKRLEVFVETVAALRQRGVNAIGTIIGNGTIPPANHIKFLGAIDNARVFEELRQHDLLVSTSIGEPYGRAIVEAMSVGTVPVCHNSGGPADFIENNVSGVLVDKPDAAAFADRIIESIAAISAMSIRAAKRAQDWQSDVVLPMLENWLVEVATRGS